MHSSLIGKIQKANRYAQEPERIGFQQFSANFRGEHDSYTVSYNNGTWAVQLQLLQQLGRVQPHHDHPEASRRDAASPEHEATEEHVEVAAQGQR